MTRVRVDKASVTITIGSSSLLHKSFFLLGFDCVWVPDYTPIHSYCTFKTLWSTLPLRLNLQLSGFNSTCMACVVPSQRT